MDLNKTLITPENSASWLASCGFIFPTNETELSRFNNLYKEIDPAITGDEVDPFRIIRQTAEDSKKKGGVYPLHSPSNKYKLVALKLNDLPPHIVQRLRINKDGKPGMEDDTQKNK